MGYMYDALNLAAGKRRELRSPDVKSESGKTLDTKFTNEIDKEFSKLMMQVKQARAENGTKVIAVTSSVPREGRTTIAYTLSRLLSQSTNGYGENESGLETSEHGVLLVDGNIEHPSLHRLFNTPLEPGLTDFVHHKTGSSIYTHIVSSQSLRLITVGSGPHDKAEIWNRTKVGRLFAKLRENFEYILIDAPPVLGHPETIALGKLTDGILLVIKANETRLEIVEEAKEQLENAGVDILGAVLNERRFFIPREIYKRI